MPRSLSVAQRRVVFRRWKQGQSTNEVAHQLDMPLRTVQRLFERFEEYGEDGIATDYDQCGSHWKKKPHKFQEKAIAMRQEHSTWGAELVRVMLRQNHRRASLPCSRTIRRWFEKAGMNPAIPGRRPPENPERATQPHARWQMDASERILLATGGQVSWLRIADEFSGAALQTTVFSLSPF
jgi:transposase